MAAGIAEFTSLRLRAAPGTYNLSVLLSDFPEVWPLTFKLAAQATLRSNMYTASVQNEVQHHTIKNVACLLLHMLFSAAQKLRSHSLPHRGRIGLT